MARVICFMLRHMHEGIITTKVYFEPPSEEEMAPIRADLEKRHGKTHPKTGEAYWLRAQESVLIVPDAAATHFKPAPPEQAPAGHVGEDGVVGISSPKLSGVGTVTNPDEQTPEQARAAAYKRSQKLAEKDAEERQKVIDAQRAERETMTITPEDVGAIDAETLTSGR
jgi:hypothetical protein